MSNTDQQPERFLLILKRIHDLVPSTSAGLGASLGFLTGGPVGAFLGAGTGVILDQGFRAILEDLLERKMSQTEGRRLAQTVLGAAQLIEDRLATGQHLRTDWFGQNVSLQDEAAEVMEGVLSNAQREYEERKLKHHAYLLANISFDPNISRATANMLIRLSGSLSYRQLGLIHIFHNPAQFHLRQLDRHTEDFVPIGLPIGLEPLYADIIELNNRRILSEETFMMNFEDINPSLIRLLETGRLLYRLMALDQYVSADIHEEIEALRL